jgi:hypothetical protein
VLAPVKGAVCDIWPIEAHFGAANSGWKLQIALFCLREGGDILGGLFRFFKGAKRPLASINDPAPVPTTPPEDHSSELERNDVKVVDESERLIKENKKGDALCLLVNVVARSPTHYAHQFDSSGKLVVRCWDTYEFLDYVATKAKDNSQEVIWIGNAYGRASYY